METKTSQFSKILQFKGEHQDDGKTLKIFSLNILAQHLITGECPSYKYLNDKANPEPLRLIRLQIIEDFLDSDGISSNFDILNLQEVGPLDTELVQFLVTSLNNKRSLSAQYSSVTAPISTGKQDLRVCTIYNSSKYKCDIGEALCCEKRGDITQFGMILNMKSVTDKDIEFTVINVHLSGGHSEQDQKLRTQQIEILNSQASKQKSPIVLTGDFNQKIDEICTMLNLNLNSIHEHIPFYNTENRVQKRERDGWSGIQIIQRCIDGIFYNKDHLQLLSTLIPAQEFNSLINQDMLSQIELRLKQSTESQEKILQEIQQTEVGFPNSNWFSDHLPVGALFQLK